jgi:hypothetical protein
VPDQTSDAPAITLAVIQRSWIGRYGPDHELAGQLVEREAVCSCGRSFHQQQLSASWLETMERRSARIVASLATQAPGFWVPAHCGPCERADLGRQARIDEARGTASHTLPDRRDVA